MKRLWACWGDSDAFAMRSDEGKVRARPGSCWLCLLSMLYDYRSLTVACGTHWSSPLRAGRKSPVKRLTMLCLPQRHRGKL